MMNSHLTRRAYLKAGGALVVTFALSARAAQTETHPPSGDSPPLDEVGSFIGIDAHGRVTIYSGKVELGTGIMTAITQIAAEELSVAFDQVSIVQGDTDETPDQGPTFSSLTTQVGGMQIRRAAATAREALIDLAATRLNVARDRLTVRNGMISSGADGSGLSFAQLLKNQKFSIKVDPKAVLKNPKEYTIVGTSVPRIDIPAKALGQFAYVQDFKLPGMVHARVVHPKAVGARLEEWDDTACRKIPGYLRVVSKGDFLAVVAKTEWAAIRASTTVETTWSDTAILPDQAHLFEYVRDSKIDHNEVMQSVGDTSTAMQTTGSTLQATYELAMNTHGSIGPSCAVADFDKGQLTVWTPSQASHLLRKQLAVMLDIPPDRVRCIYLEGAGCYGRNGSDDCSSEAALIAKEIGGPVRLQWMRADEHGWDPKGPATLLDYRAKIDDAGHITAWEADIFIPERPTKRSGMTLLGAVLAGLPRYGTSKPGIYHAGLGIPYALPNNKLTAHWITEMPLPAAWIRAPARMQNTFANECFLDEIAAATDTDPLEIRLRHLDDPRGVDLLKRLEHLAEWEARGTRPRETSEIVHGRGLCYTKYELVRTYVGVVADVSVHRTTGAIKVDHVWVVHDCGQVINPDGLRNQIEGNVVQALSRTLIEELTFSRSAVTSLDWASYPILTFPDVPAVTVDLIDRPDQVPWGAGEPTTSAIPAAISNAVYDATGARLRSVPFRPPVVRAALNAVAR